MTLNHSKTWPVNTMAVVQLRVDPNGRTYSTLADQQIPFVADAPQTTPDGRSKPARLTNDGEPDSHVSGESGNQLPPGIRQRNGDNGVILPLSRKHLELFTKMAGTNHKTTVRTDTVSTILEQDTELDFSQEEPGQYPTKSEDTVEKFHVLALTRIDEHATSEPDARTLIRRPSIKVDNWDLIYTETTGNSRCLGPVINRCNESAVAANAAGGGAKSKSGGGNACTEHKECLLADLPLDARKVTTLRRHYYPESGWGWVIVVCTVIVHVLNHGVQLSCSQLIYPGAEKFKIAPVHVAGQWFRL